MDVNVILKIAGVGLLTAIVCVILKKSDRDEIATFATLAGLIIGSGARAGYAGRIV